MKKEAVVNGKKLSYIDQGQGPVLLLGHSFLWDSEMWRPQLDTLSKKYRCIAPDLWGHGSSDQLNTNDYSLEDLAKDYLVLLSQLNIETCSIIGLSVGGMWGVEMALIAPERVSALIIMDTYVGPEPQETLTQYLALFEQVEKAGKFPLSIIEKIAPLFFSPKTLTNNPTLIHDLKQSFINFNPENIPSISTLTNTIFKRKDLRNELNKLSSIPCLVLVGSDDVARPPSEAHEMAELMLCDCIEIPNAGHIANLEQPENVTKTIETFLTEHVYDETLCILNE